MEHSLDMFSRPTSADGSAAAIVANVSLHYHVSLHRVYAAKQADRLTCMVEKHGETDTDIQAHKQESADCLAAVSIKFMIRILCPVLPRISAAVMEGESRAYILLSKV